MHAFESVDSDKDISHYLIQMVPNDTSYENYHIKPLSSYIAQQITDKFIDQSKQQLLLFWNNSKSKDFTNLSTFRGAIFENIAHRILAQGNIFDIYGPLGNKAEWSKLKIPKCEVKMTPDFVISTDNTYYRPVSTKFPVIDSWIGLYGFFQITIACKHKLIAKHLAKYIDISKEQNCVNRIYFVVPSKESISEKQPYNFESFTKNSKKPSKKKQKTGEKTYTKDGATLLLNNLEQFVLHLDLPSYPFLQF